MATRFQRGEPRPVTLPFALAKSAAIGDLLATAASGGAGYKASEQTWNTDTATTRIDFVSRFVGVSNQAKDANVALAGGAGYPLRIEAHAGGVWTFESPAAGTYLLGTLVGPKKNPDANALLDQTLEIVTDEREAIGRVVFLGGSAIGVNPAEIDVEILSRVCAPSANADLNAARVFRRFTQPAPAAKTTTTTLTAAELIGGLLTANQGAAGAATYTLPTGTLLQAALPADWAVGDAFTWSVVNISTNANEDVTIAPGTDHTVVGNMTVAANSGVTEQAWGTFLTRKSANNTFVTYRIG